MVRAGMNGIGDLPTRIQDLLDLLIDTAEAATQRYGWVVGPVEDWDLKILACSPLVTPIVASDFSWKVFRCIEGGYTTWPRAIQEELLDASGYEFTGVELEALRAGCLLEEKMPAGELYFFYEAGMVLRAELEQRNLWSDRV